MPYAMATSTHALASINDAARPAASEASTPFSLLDLEGLTWLPELASYPEASTPFLDLECLTWLPELATYTEVDTQPRVTPITRKPRTSSGSGLLLREAVRAEIPEDRLVSGLSLPLDGEVLDLDALRLGDKLDIIALGRDAVKDFVNAGAHEAFCGMVAPRDTFEGALELLPDLVGRIVPIMSKAFVRGGFEGSVLASHTAPVSRDRRHPWAYSPVILTTTGDGGNDDQGEIVAQGVTVSNRAINHPVGDARRVSLGHPAELEESVFLVLITHAYVPALPFKALGPPPTRKVGQAYHADASPAHNIFEYQFKWKEYMDARTHKRGCDLPPWTFAALKRTCHFVKKAIVDEPVVATRAKLDEMRETLTTDVHGAVVSVLDHNLVHLPYADGVSSKKRRADGTPAGSDLRNYLLIELLLLGTPLAPMQHGEAPIFTFTAPTVEGGGAGFVDRLRDFAASM
jgi:hypothetical protein